MPWSWCPPPSPSCRHDRSLPARTPPAPMPGPCSEPGRAGCPGNLRACLWTSPAPCRLSPLLLLIGHDQAGVQDVLFWLPRAVPGRETRGQSCPALPCIHRSHSCSARAHCLQALAPSWSRKLSPTPRSCSRPATQGQGLLGVPMETRTHLILSTHYTTYRWCDETLCPPPQLRGPGRGQGGTSHRPFREEVRACGEGRGLVQIPALPLEAVKP